MSTYQKRLIIAVGLLALWFPPPVGAQIFAGRIDLVIEDTTGGRMPGVTVDLTGPVKQTQVTDAQGQVHFLSLPAGTYNVEASIAGFTPYSNPNVQVAVGAATALTVRLAVAGTAETVNVEAAAPLVDVKRQTTTTNITLDELQNIPTARDPWAVMQTVPSINVDRVNVGGSESGQQSFYLAKGAQNTDNTWSIDGVPITDMGATGSSPTYYDFDMLQEMAVTTGGADASNPTPGVQLNLLLKKGTNAVRGDARYFFENESLQSNNLTAAEAQDIAATVSGGLSPACVASGYTQHCGNRTDRYKDYGFDLGGPILKDRLWAWGAAARTTVNNIVLNGFPDSTELTNYSLKMDGQITPSLRGNFTFFDGNKEKFGRSVGPTRAPETGWNQTGPTRYYKGEGDLVVGSALFLTGRFAYVTGGFSLVPVGGTNTSVYFDDDGVAHGSYLDYTTNRPQYYAAADGSYFQKKQEIKFGFSYRRTPVDSVSSWPGSRIVTFWSGYPDLGAQVTRDNAYNTVGAYVSAFATDTISLNRATITAGLRFDHQTSSLKPTTIAAVPGFEGVLPGGTSPEVANAFSYNNVAPRVGVSLSLDDSSRTVARASYAMFASQLPGNEAAFVSPFQYAYVYYNGVDQNGDHAASKNEIDLTTASPNAGASGTYRATVNQTAPTSHEFVVGIDHQLTPSFGIGAAYTYRRYGNFTWIVPNGVSSADYVQAGTLTVNKAPLGSVTVPFYSSAVDNGGAWTAANRPGYHQRYMGLEVSATKRLANHWMARVGLSTNDWREYFDDATAAIIDPTTGPYTSLGGVSAPTVGVPSPFQSGPNVNGGEVAIQSTGSGNKSRVYITPAKYQLTANGMYEAPFGVNLGANFVLRQGYVMPYYRDRVNTGDPVQPLKQVLLVSDITTFREPDVSSLDLRAEWDAARFLKIQRYHVAVDLDVFNALNHNTTLQQQLNARVGTFNSILEVMNPRIARLGVRLSF
jgi:hypothetical protein